MKHWKVLHDKPLGSIEEIISVLLKNRDISSSDQKEFLSPDIKKVTTSSVGIDLSEIKKSIEKIKNVISKNQAIIIYGDYDVDGICGTAILWETIYSFYKNVHPYIPHRVDEGYGLSEEGIKNILAETKNVGLIITVDNGIVAYDAVDFANKNDIDVIITDHHVRSEKVPAAFSIIHTTKICGTSVAYLFSREIVKEFNSVENKSHLELVALATVADLVPVAGFSRALLKYGLENLKTTKRIGLLALLEEAAVRKEDIETYHIGHVIAPRLNASGRISHAMDSLRLICTTDKNRAKKLAIALGEINRERQDLTKTGATLAVEEIKKQEKSLENLLFVSDKNYNQGVIGLIASRLAEEFYRPSIAVSIGEQMSKGSARSIPGVNIIELIRSCSELLSEAGGHPMAAGFSIETEKLEDFKKEIQSRAQNLDKALFKKSIGIDLELPFQLISLELYDALKKLEPYGIENPEPVFMTKGVTVISVNKVGKEGNHLQMVLEQDGNIFKGIKFRNTINQEIKQKDVIDVAYSLSVNVWKASPKLELRIKDFSLFSDQSTNRY